MKYNLTCSQVIALLSFYIAGKTSYQVTNFIQSHLCTCKSCREKYLLMAKISNDFYDVKTRIDNIEPVKTVSVSQYGNNFKEKLSAYLDSELPDDENIKIKKIAIANLPVRNELEGMYKVKNALNNSFEKTKNNFKNDFTKDIIVKLDIKEAIKMQEPILKLASIFIFLIVFTSVLMITML